MATNEQLQAQIDALREALGQIHTNLGVESNSPSARSRAEVDLRISGKPELKQALDRFDELRREAD
jgi:ACT domain-containing protein